MDAISILAVTPLAEQEGQVALALGGVTVGGRKAGIAASVATSIEGQAMQLGVSKLQGETEWTVDSLTVGGVPVYANGTGARFCALKVVSNVEMVAALEAAAEGVIA